MRQHHPAEHAHQGGGDQCQAPAYCGGLDIKGTATLHDGVYVIKHGPLTINSQASISGKNITFFLTGSNAGCSINGGGALNLAAPTSGSYGGMLLCQDPTANAGATNTLNGHANSNLTGVIYTPRQAIRINGNSSFGQQTPLMSIVADTVTFTGSASARTDVTGINLAAPLPRIQAGGRLIE